MYQVTRFRGEHPTFNKRSFLEGYGVWSGPTRTSSPLSAVRTKPTFALRSPMSGVKSCDNFYFEVFVAFVEPTAYAQR